MNRIEIDLLLKKLFLLIILEVSFEILYINFLKFFSISNNLLTLILNKSLFFIFVFILNSKLTKIEIPFSLHLNTIKRKNLIGITEVLFLIGLLHPQNLISALVVGTVACITEEYLMRGIVLISLLDIFQRLNNPVSRLLVPSLISCMLFGMEHFINLYSQDFVSTLVQVIITTAMGFVFSSLFIRTQNILFPMICHFGIDFLIISFNGIPKTLNVPLINAVAPAIFYSFIGFIILIPSWTKTN